MTGQNNTQPSLEDAPEDIKLAVDLIYLLETNNIEPDVAISALEIVLQDMKKKSHSRS
ncbi:pleiotropic regulatory protein RsmS [Photobacterium atrarenae]|uniref:Pleiotropic regulatory protein RsmS n=1 Tax=Photobacterium atrarenae TaxID=865757 RepID=A0ABY5GI30_9GAMM|nr:pleiotropic regulatory protein RsmS [Photobacterium atrarenae]UTV28466.1 pleiotropic regulatory protein RsmS [Photobacterium atrarenae]